MLNMLCFIFLMHEFLNMENPQASICESTSFRIRRRLNLHHAAELGDLEQIDKLLASLEVRKRHLLLLSADENGRLPLHMAAQGGCVDALKLLLPKETIDPSTSFQNLVNAPTRKGGWSALHLAAAYGHINVVQWLFLNHRPHIDFQDQEGNTPLHLAITLGHREVVEHLVTEGANLCILNKHGMMPISFCKDHAMSNLLFCAFAAGSGSFRRGRPLENGCLVHDANKRTILHYAAQFAMDSDVIAKLIADMNPAQIDDKDNQGDSFLHVAAKSGNMNVLKAIQKISPVPAELTHLLNSGGHDSLHSPGMYALLYNHRDFFDELITMGKVEIPLSSIIKGFIAELLDKPEIHDRLALFSSTLPTYLALYANKHFIFDFLLEIKLLSLSQWDDEYKRTCLHWAVLDKRVDIVEKLCGNVHLGPGIKDGDGKTALQHAFEENNHMLMEMLRAKPSFRENEEKLEKDREVYVQGLNAILVGAALIASITFAGWLQVPYNAEYDSLGLKIFWLSNSMSFFTAVATMCVTTTALVPTPSRYVGNIVNQLRLALVIEAGLLAISLAAVMWAFAAAGFAALRQSHISIYQAIMRSTVAAGGLLCLIVWCAFVLQVYRCAPPKSDFFALVLSSLPHKVLKTCWWQALLWNMCAGVGDSSRFGYPIKSRSDLEGLMEKDLVVLYTRQLSSGSLHPHAAKSPLTLDKMKQLLSKLDMSDKDRFIEATYNQRIAAVERKKRTEAETARITGHFATPNHAA